MITSAENAPFPGDMELPSLKTTGLTSPSVVRPAKLATWQMDKAKKIGKVDASTRKMAVKFIRQNLGWFLWARNTKALLTKGIQREGEVLFMKRYIYSPFPVCTNLSVKEWKHPLINAAIKPTR